ncbi:hypothetical protein ACIBCR_15135 [Micromonospora echinospora]|uniref:hypothetical protein n=1 Tax=Micromonospora echinospora TaxID=1877 RepID=UPI0037A73F55
MATPLAEAFVRVRADSSSFRRETERDASDAGDKAGRSFGGAFSRSLAGAARNAFAGVARETVTAATAAGSQSGRTFGEEFTRDATGRLRDSRGRFVTAGSEAGESFGEGFTRDANGRLRDARGRFVSEGGGAGQGFGQAFRSGALGSLSGLGSAVAAGIAIGPAVIPVVAAATAAFVGLSATAAAAFSAIGVGALAFSGVGDAVSAMDAAQKDAAKSSASLAGAQNAVASAADGVRSAEASLANTRRTVAESTRRAAQQVTDAEQQLIAAQREARDVVLELDAARQQATRRLADLNSSVQENALSQRQANLDVAEAKRALDAVLADPRATREQREQAQITYERQVLQQKEMQRRGKELASDAAKANKAGVEGSTEVAAARDRIAQANDRVKAGERALADARRAQAQQQVQGQFQIAQATQAVVSAQRSLRQATVQAGVAGGAAAQKLRDAMAELSPAGQAFAKFIFGLRDEFDRLKSAAAEGLLPGVQQALTSLLPYLPTLERFVGNVAAKMGELAVRAADALKDPFWRDFFGLIGREAVPSLERLFKISGNVARGVAGIMKAFMPLNADLGDGLVSLTERFAKWSEALGDSKGFQQFLEYVRTYGPMALKFAGDLLKIGGKLVVALAPLGAVMLTGLGSIADFLASLDPGVLLALAVGIGSVVAVISGSVGAIVAAAALFVGAWVYAYNRFDWFRKAVNWWFGLIADTALWLWRNVIQPAFQGISDAVSKAWNDYIKPALGAIKTFVTETLAPAFRWLYENVIQPVWKRIQLAFQIGVAIAKVAFGIFQIAIKAAGLAFSLLYSTVIKPIWEKIKPILSAVGEWVRDKVVPVFKTGVEAIGKAWKSIQEKTKAPVKFVVETVLNNGLLAGYNKIAKLFNVKPDNVQIPLPKGFARGGVLPGYTPGRDVHRFVSPTGGMLDLSGGEAILRPEGTRALGRDWVDGINRAARTGGVGGVQAFLGGYANGGVLGGGRGDGLGSILSAARKKASDVMTGAKGFLDDPIGTLRRVGGQLIDLIPGKNTGFGKTLRGFPSKVLSAALSKLNVIMGAGSAIAGAAGTALSKVSPFGGSAGMMRALRGPFPGLQLISGFRPGSRTLSGNVSYHASDRAVDVPPIRTVAEHIFRNYRTMTRELITPWQEFNLLNGRPHTYTGAVWRQHNFSGGNAHNHWAARLGGIVPRIPVFDRGGVLAPGPNLVDNRTGGWEHLVRAVPGSQAGGVQLTVNISNSTITSRRHAEDLIVEAYESAVRKRRIRPYTNVTV